MYKYTKKALLSNGLFILLLVYLLFVDVPIGYKVVIGLVSLLIIRDGYKELNARFEIKGDRLAIMSKDQVVREIYYKDMKYLTITRKNRHWIVIADDEKILFTIKPKIENYQEMVSEIIKYNQSNKKLIVHDYIRKMYK